MREVISRVPPSDSELVVGAFIALSLTLMIGAITFAAGIFANFSTPALGVALAVMFASIGGMALTYHRMFHDHRIILEYDEDLW